MASEEEEDLTCGAHMSAVEEKKEGTVGWAGPSEGMGRNRKEKEMGRTD